MVTVLTGVAPEPIRLHSRARSLVLDRSETFDQVLATWRNHGENEDYRFPEVHVFEHCECEEDWHIPIAEAKAGCGGNCGGDSFGSTLRREKELEAEGLFGAPWAGEALPAWGSVSREDAAGVGGFPAGPTGSFDPLPDLPPLDGFYLHELEIDCDVALAPGEEPGRFCAQPAPIDCGGIDSYYLQPPDFSKVAWYTQFCFDFELDAEDWPAHDCKAPCITPLPCELPNFLQLWAADIYLPTVVPLEDMAEHAPALGRDLTDDEANYLSAAKALLTTNIDLVEWVVCLACSWAPTVPYPDTIVDCIVRSLKFGGEYTIYAIQYVTDSKGNRSGATGVATDRYPPPQGGGPGVIVPIEHPKWIEAVDSYTRAVASGDNVAAMTAAAAMANNILHELMHLCSEAPNLPGYSSPGLADDDHVCWSIQNMSAISFLWALSQRYPELQGLACFPKADDLYFMTSEPDTTDPDYRVDYLLDAGEPYPWTPCN